MPNGLRQQGRSRVFVLDRGWFAVWVEFQPFSGYVGSALNVGVSYQWPAKDFLSFDRGGRIAPFVEYHDVAQFAPEAQRLAERAAQAVTEYDNAYSSFASAADYIQTPDVSAKSRDWEALHRGVIFALAHRRHMALDSLVACRSMPLERPYQVRIFALATDLAAMVRDGRPVGAFIGTLVAQSRELQRLPPLNHDPFDGV